MSKKRVFYIAEIIIILSTVYAQVYKTGIDSIEFLKGGDVSFIPQIEDLGGVYKDDDIPQDPLIIFKNHGFNSIRLKLWHTPVEDYNNLDKILYMAQRIKDNDLRFLLNFHYSDTWADPGNQHKPAAWEGLSFEILKDSVYEYTKKVIQALYDQQTLPEMVQIGNEISSGMLWNDGRVGGSFDTPEQWTNLGELINAAILGVRESCDSGDSILIMIHIDRGGDNGGCRWFFDNLAAQNVEFDIIGLSFYPWWHGTLSQVEENLTDLATRYEKDIIIVETAYPWTLTGLDDGHGNIVWNSGQLHAGYPATVPGQTIFIRDLITIIRNVQDHKGTGIFYWAPEYISVEPIGSPWENNALFDFDGNALISMNAFLEEPITVTPVTITVGLNTSTLMDTLQENHFAQIRGEVSGISYVTLPDGKRITWESDSELIFENRGGDYWEVNFQMYPEDELSFKFWTGFSQTEGTFQRIGWEGPITPAGGFDGNRRVIVAGETDTVITMQYYNSTSEYKEQYWQPFESKEDSVAIYFRVNMGKLMASGRFNPDINGPLTVRGDADISGGSLDWNESKVILQREEISVNNGSFWSGVCYIARSDIQEGDLLEYRYFIENDSENGWENNVSNRRLKITGSMITITGDTTLHWVYFDQPDPTIRINASTAKLPFLYQLQQNYPNPFNNHTRINYHLEVPTFVSLDLYDIQGKQITTLVHENKSAGNHSLQWKAQSREGRSVVSGIYFICLRTEYGTQVRKMILLK